MKDFILNLPIDQQILSGVVIVTVLTQIMYYLLLFLRTALWKPNVNSDTAEPLSVIICARNEYENLKTYLPLVLDQNYPNFEVIVVNDCSEDESEILLAQLEQQYKNLRHTTIHPDRKFDHSKKLAVTIGIKSAKFERLVFTDADCYPVSKNWLHEISQGYQNGKQLVLGYSGYEQHPGFLNLLIRFDTLWVGMQYLGMALAKNPYMGVGRNLSYLKQLFFSGSGFSKHYHIRSGDDDLFVNQNATRSNTEVRLSKDSFTLSKPEFNFQNWAKQKKRHLTTGKYYKFNHKLLLAIEPITRFFFYVSLIALAILKFNPYILLIVFGVRLILQLIIFKLNMNKFNEKGFLFLIPIIELILPIIHLNFIISNTLNSSKNKWK